MIHYFVVVIALAISVCPASAEFSGKFNGSLVRYVAASDPAGLESRLPRKIELKLKVTERGSRVNGVWNGKKVRFTRTSKHTAILVRSLRKKYRGVPCVEDAELQLRRSGRRMIITDTRSGLCAEPDGSESAYQGRYGGEWQVI